MTDDIVHEATYPHPPSAVWKALTTREALRAWLMDNTFEEARVGHTFRFMDKPKKIVGWDGITECEVLEAVPERRLVFAFGTGRDEPTRSARGPASTLPGGAGRDGFPATRVAWTLEPTPEGGTRVRFRHDGFTGFKGWMMRQGMNQGWGRMHRHAIPYVLDEMARGRMPTQETTRAEAKRRTRSEHAARRAQP